MAAELASKQWYIVTTYSMQETKTADNIKKRIQTMNMEDKIFRVIVCEQEVQIFDKETGLPTGKTKMKNLYPGYVFVEMIMTDDSWYIVRNTPGVTGIVGSSGGGQKPIPVTTEEMEPVLKRVGMVDDSMYERYKVGDTVKIIHGALEGTQGTVLEINRETGMCRVDTIFFGRSTPVDVEFSEIEKI